MRKDHFCCFGQKTRQKSTLEKYWIKAGNDAGKEVLKEAWKILNRLLIFTREGLAQIIEEAILVQHRS